MSGPQKQLTCFVISPIGSKDDEVRKRSDKVLKHIFRKALASHYEVSRADEIDEPGMITSQVLRLVQDSDLVVADLTGHNPNVFYELAVRHAIEKPIIHVIEPRISKIPFDVAGFRTIEFDLTDPDSIESAVEKVSKQAEQARNGKWGETPIRLASIMRQTKQDSPEILLLKQAVDLISSVHSKIVSLESPRTISLKPASNLWTEDWDVARWGALAALAGEPDSKLKTIQNAFAERAREDKSKDKSKDKPK